MTRTSLERLRILRRRNLRRSDHRRTGNRRERPVWKATSTAAGSYSLALPAGRYRLEFSRRPFATRKATLDLSAGESREFDLRMELEPSSSSVIVTAQAASRLVSRNTVPTDVITLQEIEQRQAVTLPDVLASLARRCLSADWCESSPVSLFLNGGNSNFTKVLIDGRPLIHLVEQFASRSSRSTTSTRSKLCAVRSRPCTARMLSPA